MTQNSATLTRFFDILLYFLECEGSSLLWFSYFIQKGNPSAPVAPIWAFCLSVYLSLEAWFHTGKKQGWSEWILPFLGSAEDSLTFICNRDILMKNSSPRASSNGFQTQRAVVHLQCLILGLSMSYKQAMQLTTGHFSGYNEASFKAFRFL